MKRQLFKQVRQIFIRHKLLVGIVILGVLLRLYKFEELFYYSHDQDLASWIIKDIIIDGHLRLIGQETSNQGVFIGALFYYLLIPFYLLAQMDPIGGIWLSVIISVASILSVYIVFKGIFNKQVAFIGSLAYATSFYTVFTDREVVPTTPAMLWSIWFLQSLNLILKGKQKQGFILTAILVGLVWHINLALLLLLPLSIFAFLLSRKKLQIKPLLIGGLLLTVLLAPFFVFEVRHNFQQVTSIVSSLTGSKESIVTSTRVEKLDRTMQLVYKNANGLFFGPLTDWRPYFSFIVLIIGGMILTIKRKIALSWSILFGIWIVTYIAFFTFNSINLSEYYLNGMNVVWIVIFSVGLHYLWKFSLTKYASVVLLAFFMLTNILRILTIPVNQSGYLYRTALVEYIKEDAQKNGYDCISVSYITSPGNELGYRYLFFMSNMHVNQPKSGSPVYSIVFPHSLVDRIDHSFGALGLVLPDYTRYNRQSVEQSCTGENANLTDPMFGFTK